MTGLTFPLFSCIIAIKGISLCGRPSYSSRYGTSQPFTIQSCNSFLYPLLICSGTGYPAILFFNGACVWPPAHFHVVVCMCLCWSKVALKSGSFIAIEALWGMFSATKLTSPEPLIWTLPSFAIMATPSWRSSPNKVWCTINTSMVTRRMLLIFSSTVQTPRLVRVFPSAVTTFALLDLYEWLFPALQSWLLLAGGRALTRFGVQSIPPWLPGVCYWFSAQLYRHPGW